MVNCGQNVFTDRVWDKACGAHKCGRKNYFQLDPKGLKNAHTHKNLTLKIQGDVKFILLGNLKGVNTTWRCEVIWKSKPFT